MVDFEENVRYLKGIGETRAKALARLGITTLGDLVSFFPYAYEDRRQIFSLAEAPDSLPVCVRAMVVTRPVSVRARTGREMLKLKIADDSGSCDVTYFNQTYLKDTIHQGKTYIFYGRLGGRGYSRSMVNPLFEPEESQGTITGRIMPIYHLTAGLSQRTVSAAVKNALQLCGEELPDPLPAEIIRRNRLAQARFAYQNIHFPTDDHALETARRRMVFEELFVLSAALTLLRGRRRAAPVRPWQAIEEDEFYRTLPFSPTGAQRRAVRESIADLTSGRAMSRLLQGDVGSGKTLVAAALIVQAVRNGSQAAFMAPTELLVNQHYETLCGFLHPLGIRVQRLTGSMTARQKREARQRLSEGEVDVIVGTHALLSEDVVFRELGLVVTDEQHRFGVDQRGALTAKGHSPHLLVMSATPIPRTLALIIYGDLDISVLDELPPGRQKVDTFAVDEGMRQRILAFIRRLVGEGRQVFIVCPMVEENEELPENIKNAESYARELQETLLPELRIGCIHGRMKPGPKDAVMNAFVQGELDVLVSTTVIEVGVDVPNAALMIVENAERFGLSQLHQLRGRVGRGAHKSYCVLFSDSAKPEAKERLKTLVDTNDGFRIAEADLKMRGPGDFFGSRQHGLPGMHVADLSADMRVLKTAQDEAQELLKTDPTLSRPENAPLRERIDRLFALRAETFN